MPKISQNHIGTKNITNGTCGKIMHFRETRTLRPYLDQIESMSEFSPIDGPLTFSMFNRSKRITNSKTASPKHRDRNNLTITAFKQKRSYREDLR